MMPVQQGRAAHAAEVAENAGADVGSLLAQRELREPTRPELLHAPIFMHLVAMFSRAAGKAAACHPDPRTATALVQATAVSSARIASGVSA